GLTAAQAEAGVMPGTAHGVANAQSLAERPAVVGARGADGVNLTAGARQQDAFAIDLADKHGIARELSLGNAGVLEIGSARLGLAHDRSPTTATRARSA